MMDRFKRLLRRALEEQGLEVASPWDTASTVVLIVKDVLGSGSVAAKVWTADRLLEGGNMMQVGARVAGAHGSPAAAVHAASS